jgi:hypothetical protein
MDKRFVEMEREMAVSSALEWMKNAVSLFERSARETEGYCSRFLEAVEETRAGKKDATKPVDVLSWFVNSTNTPALNMRLDMAVTHGARLSEAYRKVRELAKAEYDAAVAEKNAAARWMLTGHKTVEPSLKSAREFCASSRRPEVVAVGSFEDCYERARTLKGGMMNCTAQEALNSGGRLPVVITQSWTYYVVEIKGSDDAEV